jgi:SAM-dependent methyltransferase
MGTASKGDSVFDNQFGRDYFQKLSTYKKFSDTNRAVASLSNYYYGLYCLIAKYYTKETKQPTKVLEIGCGYSGLVNHFISVGYNYTGLDISGFIIGELQQKYPGISFVQCDIQRPINLDSKFDFVVGIEVMEHVPNPLAGLKNLYEIMGRGGAIVVSMPNPNSKIPFTDWKRDPTHVSVITKGDWESLFSQAGFKGITSTTIFSLPYFWRFGKMFSRFYTTPNIGASILLVGHK